MSRLPRLPTSPRSCHHLVDGRAVPVSGPTLPVTSPYTGQVIGDVPVANSGLVDQAVQRAAAAFPSWRALPIKQRSAFLFAFREQVIAHLEELSDLAAAESGKTVAEANAEIHKGLEVVEFALSLQNQPLSGTAEVSRGVTCALTRSPVGVVTGITPFNFPAMIAFWMFPIAVTLGNCFILKPSEKVPLTATRLGELMTAAGYPPGIFSVIHGDGETAKSLIDHPDVKAVAFVGSTPVARAVYARAAASGKRALGLGGAKNQVILVPDADPLIAIQGIVDSFTGCAGQRCMAASLLLAVGNVEAMVAGITDRARSLALGENLGAIIDAAAQRRIAAIIGRAAAAGAKLRLDGRLASPPPTLSGGSWLGPTIIDHAQPGMECVSTEIFGPVLTVVRVKNLSEAMAFEAQNPFGNATAVFTTSGAVAEQVAREATSGMVGINIGVPVPREPFSFGGTKASKFGHGDITGVSAIEFWTDPKKTTAKWALQPDATWMS